MSIYPIGQFQAGEESKEGLEGFWSLINRILVIGDQNFEFNYCMESNQSERMKGRKRFDQNVHLYKSIDSLITANSTTN